MQRYVSIDVLRTLSIVLMVIVHFLENLSGVDWAPAGLAAPMFSFLVGVSYRIWLDTQIALGKSERQISRSTFRRGFFLFVLGMLFNVLVWLPADTFNWDVLTLIGSGVLVLWLVRDLPTVIPVIICAIVFVLAPVMRLESGFNDYWPEAYFDPDWTFPQLALGYLINGYFPVFPWIIFPLVGFIVGGQAIPASYNLGETIELRWRKVQPVILFGIGFVGIALILSLCRSLVDGPFASQLFGGWTMFPASVEYVTGTLGIVLITFSLALWWIDARHGLDRFPRTIAFTRTMSQYSLSLYILHHIIHLWPLWMCGIIAGEEATYYWRKALPWGISLALVLPGLAFMYLVARYLERGKRTSLESLLRRICDPRK